MKKINFRYAFGEILIVIIGISIAFGINKYADNLKTSELKQQYISNLKKDLEADKKQLGQNIIEIDAKIKTTQSILSDFRDPSIKRKPIFKVFQIANLITFTPNNITYQTLINSGDLSLINDFDKRKAIEKYYSGQKSLLEAYERQEVIHRDYLGKYFIENIDYDKMRKGEKPTENERLLKNIIQSMSGSLLMKKRASNLAIKSCDSLLMVLNE
ncbi:DUF6090 family protein [Pseudotenacibaculum sp. MALMAid0570]|uniref:DUF6090 family protein n=1 Tax=Pseudotenacibaculum sp. MALMAid0570 TaxID=3143938 RepID=UPI0032DE4BA7